MRKPSSCSPRNVPNLYQDRILRGAAAPRSNVVPPVGRIEEPHRDNYAVGSRVEKGIRVYYATLQCTDWGSSSSGVWGAPYETLEQALQSIEHSLENWIDAMDLFADSMIPPGEEEIDLDHQPLPSGL